MTTVPEAEATCKGKESANGMLSDHTAKTVATKVGVPLEVHSDQGREFESEVFAQMCSVLGIRKTRTTPYNPRSDGMIERFNSTMVAMLSLWVNKSKTDWDEHLAPLTMAYRSAEHETNKETPNTMMLGREVRMPVDLLVGSTPQTQFNATEHAQTLQDELRLAHEAAREATGAQMRYHLKKGVCPKSSLSWTGPYVVVDRLFDVVYWIQKTPRSNPQVVHADRRKGYPLSCVDQIKKVF
ncbi:uncharacterized protein K02A2.6-like [Patiria miniata]|uniref:Integrase catalytic domain-containing protein n=1 Tax=Patiria miniata TaxID=46514 RepID=A0A914A6G9_PATMI|nr:uncharacterized protein K02A2.6-like [Patiria miniata]